MNIFYQQIPKTGTTHTIEILRHNFPDKQFSHEHEPLTRVPTQSELAFATVRDPLSWYLSAWSGELVRHLDRFYINDDNPIHFRRFVASLDHYDTKQRIGGDFSSKEYGLYSHYLQQYLFYQDRQAIKHLVRLENYEEDLEKVIGPFDNPFEEKQNMSPRVLPDEEYFDDETIERIMNNDHKMITMLGYDNG